MGAKETTMPRQTRGKTTRRRRKKRGTRTKPRMTRKIKRAKTRRRTRKRRRSESLVTRFLHGCSRFRHGVAFITFFIITLHIFHVEVVHVAIRLARWPGLVLHSFQR